MPSTAYQIESSGDWWMQHAIAHQYGANLYVRLYHRYDDLIGMFKSTDNGETWAMVGSAFTPGGGFTSVPGCGVKSGNIIYVTYQHWSALDAPDGTLRVARFDMDTDSWISEFSGGPTADFIHWSNCGIRSDGSLVIQYMAWTDAAGPFDPDPRRWKCVTCNSSGTFGSPQDLSSADQTWFTTSIDPSYGSVAIAPDDSAHFFYAESPSGSSNADTEIRHRRLSVGGTLGAYDVLIDFDGTQTYPRNSCIIGSEVAYAYTMGNGVGPAFAVLAHGSASLNNPTWTHTENTGQVAQCDLQWIVSVGSKVYGSWATSQASGKYTGVRVGSYQSGSWAASEPELMSSHDWNWWTMNALDSSTLGLVLEDWNDQTPWFIRYPLGVIGPRYYAM